MEKKIADFLRKKFDIEILILHGSRARKTARPCSDWDFLVFTKKNFANCGEKFLGQNLDIKIISCQF